MPDRLAEWLAATAAGTGIFAAAVRPLVRIGRLETRVEALEAHSEVCIGTHETVIRLEEKAKVSDGILKDILTEVRKP